MLQHKKTIPRRFACSVVVGRNYLETSGVVDLVDLDLPDIHPDAHHILAGNQRETGNLADKYLGPHDLVVTAVRFESRVSREDALAHQVLESQTNIEAGGGGGKDKVHANGERSSDPQPGLKRRAVLREKLQ